MTYSITTLSITKSATSSIDTLSIMALSSSIPSAIYAECHILYCYTECLYAQCLYSECRYAQCHGANLKHCQGRVFSFKLGCFGVSSTFTSWNAQARPSLHLKTWPRFCPVSLCWGADVAQW